jgi:hypothetical protein
MSDFKTYYHNIGSTVIFIKYSLDKDKKTATLFNYFHPPEFIKLFLQLFASSIEDLLNRDYNTFIQTVLVDEWNKYLKQDDRWKINEKHKDNETINIECKLSDAIHAFFDGLTK